MSSMECHGASGLGETLSEIAERHMYCIAVKYIESNLGQNRCENVRDAVGAIRRRRRITSGYWDESRQ